METPLTIYLADGTDLQVPYNPELMSFDHEDMNIRNPMLSDCSRFGADPVKEYGFDEWGTGGGFTALRRDMTTQSRYLLLTDESGLEPPVPERWQEALLGLYTEDGDAIAIIKVGDIPLVGEEE